MRRINSQLLGLALLLAFTHFAASALILLWSLDGAIHRGPPTTQEQIADGVLSAMHPVTRVVGEAAIRTGRNVPLVVGLLLAAIESVVWGFVTAWAILWLRKTLLKSERAGGVSDRSDLHVNH